MDVEWDVNDPVAQLKALGIGTPGGQPMPRILTPQMVRREVAPLRKRIFDNFDTLRGILDRHELTIHKRWMKKPKEQKRKVLLAAWDGNMSLAHRPDFAALWREGSVEKTRATRYRDSYMFPYINQEDLLKPRLLLIFLRTRARHPPGDFAAADWTSFHIATMSQAVNVDYLNEYIMIFTGRNDPTTYAELVHWDDYPDGFNKYISQKVVNPGTGLLILEVQDRIMAFLVSCAKQILHEMTEDDAWLHYPIQPEPPLASGSNHEQPSWATLAAEAPYRPPSQLNFAHLEGLLASRRDAAADHLWLLREDPGYFADNMNMAREHRQEIITDHNGRKHPLFTSGREELLWNRVLRGVITRAYLGHETWVMLHAQAAQLSQLQHSVQVSPDQDLPKHYMNAILKFQLYLSIVMKGPITELKTSFVASPPMRPYFSRKPVVNPADRRLEIEQKPGAKMESSVEKLLWLLRTLWDDGHSLLLLKATNVVDEIQHLVDTDAHARASISSFVADRIGEISMYSECLHQLDRYQPWARTFQNELFDLEEGFLEEFQEINKPWAELQQAIEKAERTLIDYGVPTERRFHYPVDKRQTRENVDQMRQAEENLDLFWSKLDKCMTRELGNLAVVNVLAKRTMHRTAPWIDSDANATQTQVESSADELLKPLSDIYLDLQLRTESTLHQVVAAPNKNRVKEKTRGTANPIFSNGIERERGPPCPDKAPNFAVDSRALKAFRTLFFTPSTTATPGELAWADFLHAMASVGFGLRKLYGSVWQFSPTGLDVEASIHFHEPHPSGKIPYRIARRHGRRLHRTYGWDVSMFSLADASSLQGE